MFNSAPEVLDMASPKFEIVERNLRYTMRFFSLANDQGEIREMPGVSLVSSGIEYSVFNSALLSAPVFDNPGELERRIVMPAVHFAGRGLPWSYWVCEDLMETPLRRKARRIFSERGLRMITEAPGMMAERVLPATRRLPKIECQPVSNAQTRFAFTHISSIAFHIPFPTSRQIYNEERSWRGDFKGYVGYADGIPVATTAIMVAAGAVGVYSVSTLPDHRGKGFGEALLREVLQQTFKETGVERTVLQSTPAGHAMYEKMGYRAVTKFTVYLSA